MWDENKIYPRIKKGHTYTKDMNDQLVETLNTQTFSQGRAILKIRHYTPENLIVQHLPVKERE